MNSLLDIRTRLAKKSAKIKKLFSSPDGKEVLDILEEEFNGDNLFYADPYTTAHKLGSRDVVVYLQQLIRHKEETE
jgi:hypothetical protein